LTRNFIAENPLLNADPFKAAYAGKSVPLCHSGAHQGHQQARENFQELILTAQPEGKHFDVALPVSAVNRIFKCGST